MGFKEVASLDADVTIAIGKKDKKTGKAYPKQAEGYLLGSRSVQSKRGDSKIHILQTAEGNLGVWGTTDLNRKLAAVPVGAMVRITSTGTKPTPNGDMYTYKVEVDADNTVEVPASFGAESDNSEETSNEEDSDSTSDDDSNEDSDTDVAAVAAAARLEAKKKVEELLKRGKSK